MAYGREIFRLMITNVIKAAGGQVYAIFPGMGFK